MGSGFGNEISLPGVLDVATGDLDFVATSAAPRSLGLTNRFLGFAEALETLFGRIVDVFTERSIRKPFFKLVIHGNDAVNGQNQLSAPIVLA